MMMPTAYNNGKLIVQSPGYVMILAEMIHDARVVPLDDLLSETMDLAGQIAEMHPFALAQAKRAVNQTLDVQGFYSALQSVFDIHQTGHGNAMSVSGYPILVNLDQMKNANRD